jgi:hypothetical protein
MKPAATLALAIILSCLFVGSGPAHAQAPSLDELEVVITPAEASVVLGDVLVWRVEVTNTGAVASPPAAVHLDITDPDATASVDPEDWTSTLTRPIEALAPRQTITLEWEAQPISVGMFTAYAVVVSNDTATLAASGITRVQVSDQRTLNPGGILPVVLGAPVIVGGLLGFRIRRSRG